MRPPKVGRITQSLSWQTEVNWPAASIRANFNRKRRHLREETEFLAASARSHLFIRVRGDPLSTSLPRRDDRQVCTDVLILL